MSRFARLVSLFAVPALFAACSGTSDTPFSPATPRYDGGLLVGTNATPPSDSAQTTTSSTGGNSGGGLDSGAPNDSTGRGGLLVGTN
jgi:hypothetical protein